MQIILWGLCMLVGLAIMIINFPKSQVGVTNDEAYYITLARSLLHADEFGLINFPGAPLKANYPFGFPLLLAPLAAIFPTELSLYKILSILATLVNTSLIFWGWRWLSRGLSYWWGLGVSALYIFSLTTVDLSGRVMSEPVFLTFYLMAMLLAERQASGKTSYWWSLWMAFSLTFLLYVRSIGIVLVFTILVYLVLRTRSRFFRWLLPTLAGMAALLVFVVAISPLKTVDLFRTNYIFDTQAKLIARLIPFYKPPTSIELELNQDQPVDPGQTDDSQDNFGKLFHDYIVLGFEQHVGRGIRSTLSPYPGDTLREKLFVEALGMPFLANLLSYLFAAVVIVGYVYWFKLEKITLFNLSSLIYFAALFLWLWKEPRFLYPILPQLATGLLLGVKVILSLAAKVTHKNILSARQKFQSITLRTFVIIFCLLLISKDVRFTDSRQNVGVISSRTGWIKEHTSSTSIVMTEYPVIDYLYSNRTTVSYPQIETPTSQFCQYLESEKVDYVLVAPRLKWIEPRYIPSYSIRMQAWLPVLEELDASHKLTLIHAAEDTFTRVYHVSSEVSCTP
jgi:hypothetical protein